MYQAGLVLEGGGMKGVYTTGVLDFFLEKGIEFSSVYGVSAGAIHMASYLSKQKKRSIEIAADYADSKKYWGVESLLLTGDLFNVETCYHLIPTYLHPYDYETFNRYRGKAYSVVTNISTGQAEYMHITDMNRDIDKIRASASMPLVSRNVKIDGAYYLDGGIADSVPIQRSISDGNEKNIVVLTKEEGYRRQQASPLMLAAVGLRYIRFPRVYEVMRDRATLYNGTMKYLARQQACGRAYVIRPKTKSDVGRVEKDGSKLWALYEQGYRDAREQYEDILRYLES